MSPKGTSLFGAAGLDSSESDEAGGASNGSKSEELDGGSVSEASAEDPNGSKVGKVDSDGGGGGTSKACEKGSLGSLIMLGGGIESAGASGTFSEIGLGF